MARNPRDLDQPPLEFIDDGLSDEQRADRLSRWLDEFDRTPAVPVEVKASDTLAELRAKGEL